MILVGHLGQDPSISYLPSGLKVATFSLATSESWKDKNNGELKSVTEWHKIKILNERLSDVAEKYLHKGSKVYIEGKIQTNKWTGKDGNERTAIEIVLTAYKGELCLLDSKKDAAPFHDPNNVHDPKNEKDFPKFGITEPKSQPVTHEASKYQDLDDEVPF